MVEADAAASAPADLARDGREDVRPPADELTTALLGDAGLLVPLSASGEPQQLFWPHPDRDPNLEGFALGLAREGDDTTMLLRTLAGEQRVEADADVVTTLLTRDPSPADAMGQDATDATDATGTGSVRIDAVIDPDGPVLMLRIEPAGAFTEHRVTADLSLMLGGTTRSGATHVDASGVLVAFRQDRVLAVALAGTVEDAGVGPGGSADGAASGSGNEHRAALLRPSIEPAGPQASSRHVKIVAPVAGCVTLVLAFGHDRTTAVAAARRSAGRGFAAVADARRAADDVMAEHRTPTLVGGDLDGLDRVGLRVLHALQDPEGGVLAAPESDPDRRRSGGYGFVWARDLAFVVIAAAVAGRRDVVDAALGWLVSAQSDDGLYEQRHWSDATPAPSWGLQLDETGAVLHAIGEVARVLDDPTIVTRCWPTVRAGADALVGLLHPGTGLPLASLDAWEERVGVHTYTTAATIAGLEAAARMAQSLIDASGAVDGDAGGDEARSAAGSAVRWQQGADRARAGLDAHLWSQEHGRFLRSRDVARADADGTPVPERHQPPGRPAHPVRSVDAVDATVDASLLGLAYPFGVLAHDDPRLRATVDAVERELRCGPGLLRYPGDTYVGGNPWLLTRLWLGLARRAPGSHEPAEGVHDVAGCATGAMLLAEQVDAVTGRPVWIVPLAWSHAFYALACRPDHRT